MIELTRFQLIQRLCSDAAKDICITADGGILGGVGYGDSRLFENGIYFHDLNKEELVAAIVGLTGVMSPAVNITYVSRDQVYLCAWCAQVFSDSNTSLRHEIKNEVLYFMRLVAHTALSRFNPDYFSNVPINIGVHSRSVLMKTHQSLLFLALPLLEALLRFCCRDFVSSDGLVKKEFSRGREGRPYRQGNVCSNLGHLIDLYRKDNRAMPEKQCAIMLLDALEPTRPDADVAAWLFQLRNGALHGEIFESNAAEIVLNICFSLCLGELSAEQYVCERDWVYRGVLWSGKHPVRPDWSIYPPEF